MLPAEHLGHAKVGDLQMTLVGDEQILQLDVAMGDTMRVEVGHASKQLLEETQSIRLLHVSLLDQREQLSLLAVGHDVIPSSSVGAETDRLDDVGVIEALGDAELRFDLLDVVVLALHLALLPKLLHRVELIGRTTTPRHELHVRRRSGPDQLPTPSRHDAGAHKLHVQLRRGDVEVIRQGGAHAASLQSDTRSGMHADGVVRRRHGHAVHAGGSLSISRLRSQRRLEPDLRAARSHVGQIGVGSGR